MELILIILILAFIGILCVIYYYYTLDTYIVRVKKNQVMEFKTSLDLTGLPIITLYQGKKPYNFLLDTGSNTSYINKSSNINVTKTGTKDVFMGAEGVDMECEIITVNLYRGDNNYECKASLADLDKAFEELKKQYGVSLSGIIGCDFMDKYNYCIDFKEWVVYIRK